VDPSAFRGAAASERWALRHHGVIALDATIGGIAPRMIGSTVQITSISVGIRDSRCAATHIIEKPG
jgi:hypothetical protein